MLRMAMYEQIRSTVQVPFRIAFKSGQCLMTSGTWSGFGKKCRVVTATGMAIVTPIIIRETNLSFMATNVGFSIIPEP